MRPLPSHRTCAPLPKAGEVAGGNGEVTGVQVQGWTSVGCIAHLNATTQGVKQTFKKLEAKRRRQSIKVVRGPQMARG